MEKEKINQFDPKTGMYGLHRCHINKLKNNYTYECNYVLGRMNGWFAIWQNNKLSVKSYYVDNVVEGESIKYGY